MAYPRSRSNTPNNVAYFEVEREESATPPQPPLQYQNQNPFPPPLPQHYNRTPPPQHYNRTPPPQHYNRTPPPPQHYNNTPPPQHRTPPPQHYNRTPPPQQFNRTPSPYQPDRPPLPPVPYNQGPINYNNNAPYPPNLPSKENDGYYHPQRSEAPYQYPSRTPPPQYLPPPVPTPPPQQQPPYNNPGYSTATFNGSNPHLTQPYPRPSTSPQQQQNSIHPSAPPIRKESPSVEASRPDMYRTGGTGGGGPAPPRAENYSSPRPVVPTSIVATPTYGGGSSKTRGSSPRRHHHDDTDFADCCSVCGCIRCSCTLFMIVLGLAFIVGGLALFAYSRALPGKCGGLCDPNANNGTLIGGTGGNSSTALTSATNTTNNAAQNATNSCTSICSKGVYNGLHYSGITLLCIGIIMLAIQVFNMICRVGKSGGRGSGCCYCC